MVPWLHLALMCLSGLLAPWGPTISQGSPFSCVTQHQIPLAGPNAWEEEDVGTFGVMVFVFPGHSDVGWGPAVLEMAEHRPARGRGKRQQPLSMELQQQRGQTESWA